jgi:hypothetical protein
MTSEQRKGHRILRAMFEISRTTTRRPDRECFNQVVRFLADYVRIHPLPREDRPVADRLMPLAKPLLAAWYDEPDDYLGQLFSEQNCAIDRMGQVITPPWIVSYINDSVIGKVEEMEEGAEERWKLVLDPCTGTGRFLLDLAWRHRDKKLALFGVELDLDLYRACLVNMRLYALEMPYLILRADALIVDLEPSSPNWRFANRWRPPDWQTEMVTPGGETYADWRRGRGLGERPEGEEVGQVPPPVMTGTDELPLFRGLEGEQRWEEDYHKR